MTIFLRFADEAEARKVMQDFLGKTDDGVEVWRQASHEWALDLVGTVYKSTGKQLETTEGLVEEKAAVPGFHINLKMEEPPAYLKPYTIFPLNPVQIFFGDAA